MSDLLRAIVLGAVQALTEFLPISSSVHLILVPWLFGWEPFGLAFDAALHLGTLLAVLVYFRNDLLAMARGLLGSWRLLLRGKQPDDQMGRIGLWIVIASIPAGVVGLLVESTIDDYFHQDPISRTALALSAVVLILMGLLLFAAERYGQRAAARGQGRGFQQLRFRDAMLVGFAQAAALLPGVSRSGSTLTAGLFSGLERPVAARFAFLLGVPIVAAAGAKQLLDLVREGIPAGELDVFIVGVVTSAVVGYLAVAGLMQYIQRRSISVFVYYRIVVGCFILTLIAAGFRA